MKLLDVKLLESVGGTYDQTRTTIQGRVRQKTVNSKQVLGPNEPKFLDVVTDTAGLTINTTTSIFVTKNNRLFVIMQAVATTVTILAQQHYIALYDWDPQTGNYVYQGRCVVQLPVPTNTAHSFRSMKVLDNPGTTGWKIVLMAKATAAIGGTYLVNNVDASDFTFAGIPTVIDFATGNNQKAVYQLVRSLAPSTFDCTVTLGLPTTFTKAAHGLSNGEIVYISTVTGTAFPTSALALSTKYFVVGATTNTFQLSANFAGAPLGAATGPTSANIKVINEEMIAPVGMALDEDTGILYTMEGLVNAYDIWVRDLSTISPTYSFSAAASAAAGTPGVITTSSPHGFEVDDIVSIIGGSLPGGLLLKQIYFVRNPTATTFELSLTVGGVSIAFTSSGIIDIGRPAGRTDSGWQFKTQQLPVIAGALSLTDSVALTVPTNAPLNANLNGEKCIFFGTSSLMAIGKVSDLASESPFWPSLTQFNFSGQTGQFVTPSSFAHMTYSTAIDQAIFTATGFNRYFTKEIKNNEFKTVFGEVGFSAYETFLNENLELRLATQPSLIQNKDGWLFASSATGGQRGIIAVDLTGDTIVGTSFIVSKVVDLPNNVVLKNLLFDLEREIGGGQLDVSYRTSGFNSISGGWISLNEYDNLDLPIADKIQFKIAFKVQCVDKTLPLQIAEMSVAYESPDELSDNWEYSYDDSSAGSPTRIGFRLKQTYPTSIPSTLKFQASDLSGLILVSHTITTNPSNFQYSTDGGTTWLNLGTIPNTVGTLVRYNFTSPPGVDIRPSLKDS
jgi:hypothetical protein